MRTFVKALYSLALGVLIVALFMPSECAAQVAGQNVNMVSGTQWPTGDPFLQRQNEPSMAVSTRNPMHIMAGANDYRTVDLETLLSRGTETGDSWLGLFKSFDGGLTWQSTLLPGCPELVPQCTDNNGTGHSALQGIYGAASDPVVRAGSNGIFYYAGLAFVRPQSGALPGTPSAIFVARYTDLNNIENSDPIAYIDTHTVAIGNTAGTGQFLDKPAMAVDIPRAGANTCSFSATEPGVTGTNGQPVTVNQSFAAGNVYVAYTEFLAATKNNSTPTQLMFTHSTDCGVTWSTPVQINKGTITSQGSAIAVNPLNGNVYVAWRQFASPGVSNAIMVAQSTNAGKSFSAPVQISTFQPFDQNTTGTSFRTNAYPSITTDMFGFVYVAFSAKGLGPNGDARVVAAGSIDGTHWTPAIMVDNPKQNSVTNPSGRGHQIMPAITFANGRLTILYYDMRFDHYVNFYTPSTPAGTYTSTLTAEGELAPPFLNPNEIFTPYIDDYGLTVRRHTIDLRVLELGIFPTLTLGPSVSVSQYAYGCCVPPGFVQQSPTNIEQFKFNVPNLPLFANGSEPFLGDYIEVVPSPMFVPHGTGWAYNFTPSVNPLFHATWTDNRDVVPPADGNWGNYTPPIVAGTTGTQSSIFEPGQTLPACQPGQEGMRNQNIYTAQITGGLVVGAPGNAKPLGTTTFTNPTTGITSIVPYQRAFAVEAQNVTSQQIFVRFSIANQPTGGTASFLQFSQLTTLDVTIPQYSSVSRSVFVTSTNPQATVTINVAQISAIGGSVLTNGLSAMAVLNPDASNPNIQNPNIQNQNPNIQNAEVTDPNIQNANTSNPNIQNPNIQNPNIQNPNIQNPNIQNPNIQNPNIQNVSATTPNIQNPNIQNPDTPNPNIQNPNIQNPNIQNNAIEDVIYPMSNQGNTTATYNVQVASASTSGVPAGIVVQLIINKLYQTPIANQCQLGVETHWVTVSNIIGPKLYGPTTAGLGSPNIQNPNPTEGSVTLAPGETAYVTLRVQNPMITPAQQQFNPVTAIAPVTVPHAVDTTTVLSNPGNTTLTGPVVYPQLTITTAALPATDQNTTGYSFQLQSTGGKPGTDTWSLVSSSQQGFTVSSSGLLTAPALGLGPNSVTVKVADSAVPANTATKTLSIPVNNIFAVQTLGQINDAVAGQAYIAIPFTTSGGTGPITWSSSPLPGGLSINSSTGHVSGIPTIAIPAGTSVTVTATDSALPPSVLNVHITIRVGALIAITPPTLPSGTIGVAYSRQLSASGGIGGLVFGPPSPATGVLMDGTGFITIANPQTSSVSFSVSVHDQANPFQFATANYTIIFTGSASANVSFIQQPPDYVGGQPNPNSPIIVQVVDNTNAAIAGANVTLAFNGTPPCPTATLSGTLTLQTDLTGSAFFTFQTIDHGQRGYTLTASVLGAAPAISNPFNVSGFCETGNMNTARRNHIVLTLPNGKILLTGGASNANGTGGLASAELYDSVGHSFTTISPMNVARVDHTMTLLLNGKVLITGGYNTSAVALSSAELFDPTSNSFTLLAAPMSTTRAQHTATLLPNGQVLIAGGNDMNGNIVPGAELFDPATNQFNPIPQPMVVARQIHHADLLPNGQVLISGGLDGANNALASAETYDPVAGTFTPTTGSMTTARGNHSSALLYNGQVLVAGGLTGPGNALALTATAELYNPATQTFTPTGGMSIPRGHYAGIVLGDGTVFISGGVGLPAGTNADIYNPAFGTFSTSGNFTAVQTGAREGVAPDGTVLLASGVNSTPVTVPNSELFYPPVVAPGIVVTSPSTLPPAAQNQPYSQLLLERGGIGLVTWQPLGIPSGLTLTSNGILTGTPTNTGTFDVTFTVTDTSTPPQTLTTTLSLQIAPSLAITTTTLPNGVVGVPYNNPIVSTGGTQPVSFSLTTAAFPPGLTITQPGLGSQTGALAGTPTTPGTYNFSESVADSSIPQLTATQNYTVTIAPLFVGTTPNTVPNGTEGVAYSQNLTSTGGTPPFTYVLRPGIPGNVLPPGFNMISLPNTTVGQLTGTPTSSGVFSFQMQATDSSSPAQVYFEQLTITVQPQPPTNASNGPITGTSAGIIWEFSLSSDVVGYNVYRGTHTGGPYSLVASGLPATAFSYTDSTVVHGTTYFYVVRAIGLGNVESVNSDEVTVNFP